MLHSVPTRRSSDLSSAGHGLVAIPTNYPRLNPNMRARQWSDGNETVTKRSRRRRATSPTKPGGEKGTYRDGGNAAPGEAAREGLRRGQAPLRCERGGQYIVRQRWVRGADSPGWAAAEGGR